MGEVYRARDIRLGRDVAVKVLPEHLALNPDALSPFRTRSRAVAALSHPNILAIHDSDRIMTFPLQWWNCWSETLRKRIQQSPLSWRKDDRNCSAIAEGLSAAHSKGVISSWFKTRKYFSTSDGQVKILDFGLAQWKPATLEQELLQQEHNQGTQAEL